MTFLSSLMSEEKKFCFMAGLPRSGSTLLSSILNQNPRVYSGPSSPVLSTIHVIEDHHINNELYHGFPKPYEVTNIIQSVTPQFYGDIEKPVIIDKKSCMDIKNTTCTFIYYSKCEDNCSSKGH